MLLVQMFLLHQRRAHLASAASTGSASEAPLLAWSGPAAVPNLGGTSCLACETRRSAAGTHRSVNLCRLRGFEPDAGGTYRLLAEEEAAELRIGSRVWEAQDGARRLGLPALRHLVGRGSADRRLLIGWSGCSHRHLETF